MVAETKLYDALSIKPDASQDEIKKAYRQLILSLLPLPTSPSLMKYAEKQH